MTETPKKDILQPTDDEARARARRLIDEAAHAALAVISDGAPFVSRIALGTTPDGDPMTLISGLARHTGALRAEPKAALLIGEPGERGDPLTHPRLMVQASARFIEKGGAEHAALRDHYLSTHPKSKLYADFPDFAFVVFTPQSATLNGGFARAYALTPEDLRR